MSNPQPEPPKRPYNEEILYHMRRQTELLEYLTVAKKSTKRRAWLRDGVGFVKWGGIVAGIVWALLKAKQFFEGLFASITPDFSGITDTISGYANGGNTANTTTNDLIQQASESGIMESISSFLGG